MEVVHKINITDEARLDVVQIGLEAFDWRSFKSETEEYITNQAKAGRIPWWGYFRADYIDEDSGKRLKLFVYRAKAFGLMQTWDLRGICNADDWTQEAEDDGQVRAWLKTTVPPLVPEISVSWLEKIDWVIRARVHEILKNTDKTLWVNVLEEVKSAFNDDRDKAAAERLAFLQSVHFSFKGRRRARKAAKRD